MFLCRRRRSKVGGMGFLKLISQAFPRPLPQSPLVFFPLFRSLSFSLVLHYLNAWNRLRLSQRFHYMEAIKKLSKTKQKLYASWKGMPLRTIVIPLRQSDEH